MAVTLCGVAVACAPKSRRTPDDTLVVLIEVPMKSADPRYAVTSYDLKLSRLVAPGLVAVDTPDQRPRLELAERIEAVDPLTWDAVLLPGVKFSDGTPVTAADVAWTYSTMLAEGSDSLFHKNLTERFTSVEAVDARTARFHLVAPLATFRTDIDLGIMAEHSPPGTVIGAGPYKVESLGAERVILAANPYYHGTPPLTPRVDVRTVRDAAARILMLVGGSADIAQNAIRLDLVDDVARQPRIQVERGPSSILTYLLINNTDPVLADVRVRRAMAMAIDRPAIIAAKLGGRAVAATGLLAPGHWAYEPDVDRWPYDPARARQLLDEAGVRDPDGPGPLPRLRLTYKTSSDQFRVALARVIAAQLGAIGIAVDVRAFEFATFFADIKKGSYQIATMQSSDIGEPDTHYTFFHSSRIPSKANPDGGNRWRYVNPRIDQLTEAGRREIDPQKRLAIYSEVQKIIARDLPIVPLWHEDNIVVANRDVTGYRIAPNARLSGLITAIKQRP